MNQKQRRKKLKQRRKLQKSLRPFMGTDESGNSVEILIYEPKDYKKLIRELTIEKCEKVRNLKDYKNTENRIADMFCDKYEKIILEL